MLRFAFILGLVPAALMGSHIVGKQVATAIETQIGASAVESLFLLEVDWAEVSVNGLTMTVAGLAPNREAKDRTLSTLRQLSRFVTVIDRVGVSQAPELAPSPVPAWSGGPPEVMVELHRTVDGITLTGHLAGAAMRRDLLSAIRSRLPEVRVLDLTGTDAEPRPDSWRREFDVAAMGIAALPNAHVRAVPGRVTVEGVAKNSAAGLAATRLLEAAATEAVAVELAIEAPMPVISPFRFRAMTDRRYGFEILECAARGVEEAGAIADLVAAIEGRFQQTCAVGLGGPDVAWAVAVEAGLDALGRLGAGTLEIDSTLVRLTAAAEIDPEAVKAAMAELAEALPPGLTLAPEPGWTFALDQASRARERFWLHFTRADGEIRLAGMVPGETELWALRTYARALVGGGRVDLLLQVSDEGAPPRGWQEAAIVAISALAELEAGSAKLAEQTLRVTARLPSPETAALFHRSVEAQVPEGWAARTELTVDLPAAVAAIPADPQRCVTQLNDVVADRSLLFDSGSAVLSDESVPQIIALGAVLARCEPVSVEIAGHTDSFGREAFNLRLSQARAEAVRAALVAAGVEPDWLVAQGYGEKRPIATNKTEAGRAKNRRIAFSLLE